jgi:8-hydroxy-5-deazaflavin:NADPH oxidoreductase
MRNKTIGIIGTGNVGHALAVRLIATGYTVKVANSRGPHTLIAFENTTKAKAVPLSAVAADADMLIIAIPFGKIRELTSTLHLPEKVVVVDTGNYYPERDGTIAEIEEGMPETQWVSAQLGVPVVKAFNNIMASSLASNWKPAGIKNRIALPVAGDDQLARNEVKALVEELGFTAYDAGDLSDSWRQQPGEPAYCTDPSLSELLLLLARANRKKAMANRDKAAKLMARIPPTFTGQQLVRASRLSAGLDIWQPKSWAAMLQLIWTILRA